MTLVLTCVTIFVTQAKGLFMKNKHIRQLRLDLDLSQERFARLLGVSLQTVRRWESGLTRPLPIINLKLEELQREAKTSSREKGGVPLEIAGDRGNTWVIQPGLGGLLKGIGSLLNLVSRMTEEGKEDYAGSGEIDAMGGKLKGVYGFSIRTGLGGKPVIEQFGNIQDTDSGSIVMDTTEPLVDILDEGKRLAIIAEIPGVEEKGIHLRIAANILYINASARNRKYYKEVLLPSNVNPRSLKSSYKNGVLEISVLKN